VTYARRQHVHLGVDVWLRPVHHTAPAVTKCHIQISISFVNVPCKCHRSLMGCEIIVNKKVKGRCLKFLRVYRKTMCWPIMKPTLKVWANQPRVSWQASCHFEHEGYEKRPGLPPPTVFQTQWTALQHLPGVSAAVHEVQLCQHADLRFEVWSSKFEIGSLKFEVWSPWAKTNKSNKTNKDVLRGGSFSEHLAKESMGGRHTPLPLRFDTHGLRLKSYNQGNMIGSNKGGGLSRKHNW